MGFVGWIYFNDGGILALTILGWVVFCFGGMLLLFVAIDFVY